MKKIFFILLIICNLAASAQEIPGVTKYLTNGRSGAWDMVIDPDWILQNFSTANDGDWQIDTNENKITLTDTNITVGIATSNPLTTLHINGSLFVHGATGDFDDDGEIFSGDASIFQNYFGNLDSLTDLNNFIKFDLDGNGEVNLTDWYIFSSIHPSFDLRADSTDLKKIHARIKAGKQYGVMDDSTFQVMRNFRAIESVKAGNYLYNNIVYDTISTATDTISFQTSGIIRLYINTDSAPEIYFEPPPPLPGIFYLIYERGENYSIPLFINIKTEIGFTSKELEYTNDYMVITLLFDLETYHLLDQKLFN